VLEIEPQTLWRRRTDAHDGIGIDRVVIDQLLSLPQAKIAHGIGMPIGGTVRAPVAHRRLLHRTLREIGPAWFSEHLSFNRCAAGTTDRFAGFLLPPLQCSESIAIAADNVRDLTNLVNCPAAFETGVNYLQPSRGEIGDGEFFAAVAQAADCGILLDLHNLWVNEQNGRQPWREVLRDIPVDRVWEVHVAGGTFLDGYYLDAHCDVVPDEVLCGLEEWIGRWPNLRAVVFEILPTFVVRVGLEKIGRQLEQLSRLWRRCRIPQTCDNLPSPKMVPPIHSRGPHKRVFQWEQALVARIRESAHDSDPGIRIYRRLIADARAAAVSQLLRSTVTLLFLALGAKTCEELMESYVRDTDPQAFSEDEAVIFCEFLSAQGVKAPFLEDVRQFEFAILQVARTGQAVTLEFDNDPEMIFASLLAGKMPPENIALTTPIKITVQA
jgi:uncharacterized protein (UPF0276 family)